MAISFFVLFAVPGCFSCNARTVSRNKAKVVEQYVVSANFDENTNFPQLNDRNQRKDIYQEEVTSRQEAGGFAPFAPVLPRGNHRGGDGGELQGDVDHRTALEERDYLVHHHHLPPVSHPPPPPPPPPAPLAYAPSLFAVGLITFLMLLNSLQTSLLLMKSKGSVLGSVTGALGRRKRFASEDVEEFLEKYEEAAMNSTQRKTSSPAPEKDCPEYTSTDSFLFHN